MQLDRWVSGGRLGGKFWLSRDQWRMIVWGSQHVYMEMGFKCVVLYETIDSSFRVVELYF